MTRKTLGRFVLLGLLCLGGYTGTATGQGWTAPPIGSSAPAPYYGAPANVCGCSTPITHVSAAAICQPPPVTHVAVTEVHECRQTVQRPVVEQQIVEQPVTEYHPVTETQTANVPTVSYQTVTECQTRTRDLGQWVTNYRCRQQVSPCEYDGRPGVAGWLNRSGYSMRMAFTPVMVAERTYVPNVVTENVPVQRQVAIPGTRQVAYQVTRMVAVQTTRKVAVNSVRMVAQEVVTRHPVTVMRPIGSVSAMAVAPSYNSSAQLQPTPAASVPRQSLAPPTKIQPREARRNALDEDNENFESPPRSSAKEQPDVSERPKAKPTSYARPTQQESGSDESSGSEAHIAFSSQRATAPSIIRTSRWVATRRPTDEATTPDASMSIAVTRKSNRAN